MLLIDLFVETRDVGRRPKAHEAVGGMPSPATWALIQHLGCDPALNSLPFGEEQKGQKIYEAKNYSHESKNLEVLNFWIHWSNLQAPLSK